MFEKIGALRPARARREARDRRSLAFALAATVLSLATASDPAEASGSYLQLGAPTPEPSGAAGLCERYTWACENGTSGRSLNHAALAEISRVNLRINRTVRDVSDYQQYGLSDHWSYPTNGAGDCEDFALAKKRELVGMGFPANRLLLATAHSNRVGPHAVLVLRMDEGDYVLDNLTDEILPWRSTGYDYLRVQNPSSPSVWLTAIRSRP